ncbi:MAG TPA: hypothetical protein VFS43_18875 [Polyangiaceae bacterium]|nr:hypothetical protein [Polyangiaceae bacterium]
MGRGLRHLPRPAQGARRLSGRLAVALAALAAASSCLVTSSSNFEDPAQLTPPFLSAATADPPLSSYTLVDDPTVPITFSATVRSQDLGNPLFARLYLDFPTNSQSNLLDQLQVPLGSLDEGPRRVALTWTPAATSSTIVLAGCHSVTLMVSRNFQAIDVRPDREEDETDFLVWWVYIPSDVLVGGQGAGGAGGAGGDAGAAGTAGAAGLGGAGGRFDSIERCLLLGQRR